MPLGKRTIETLRDLARDPSIASDSADGGQKRLVISEGAATAQLEIADNDRYSVTLRSLEVELDRPAPEDVRAFLSERAAAIIRQLSFLEEPLAVWELDEGERTAQLRSSPPLREGEEVSYWEVALRGDGRPRASITRYRWRPGIPEREAELYPATFALVGRIMQSLEAALSE